MHSKIYKAKLITVHSGQKDEKPPEQPQKANAIHAYFGMLQHIFQRNKHMIKQLKLSGTRIQHKNRQNIKGGPKSKRQSELVRSNTRQQTESQSNLQELLRQKSLPNYGIMMTSLRNQSVQPRYHKENVQKIHPHSLSQQFVQFIPIGQASHKKIDFTNKVGNEDALKKQGSRPKGFIILNFNNDRVVKHVKTEREMVPPIGKKNSIRTTRNYLKTKSEPNEAPTSYSSIRTSQNSPKEVNSAIKLPISPQEVTPW